MALSFREIEDRLEEAALTLRRMPDPPGSGPKGYGSGWPDYIQEAKHAALDGDAKMRVVPGAAQIARMDEALTWLAFVSPDDAKIVWLRAEGRRWRQVGIAVGVVRQTVYRRWVAALITIGRHLAKAEAGKPAKKAAKPRAARKPAPVAAPAQPPASAPGSSRVRIAGVIDGDAPGGLERRGSDADED